MENIITIGMLVLLEGLLSWDNVIVLAMLVKQLPDPKDQKKALTYGIWGAILFRFIALMLVTYLVKSAFIKVAGAIYLIYLVIKHFFPGYESEDNSEPKKCPNFWSVVAMVEMMDIAFSADSIMASVGVSSQLWVIFTGGVIGIVMMRFAAQSFIAILKRFPKFEESAYYLIAIIAVKMLLEAINWPQVDFHDVANPAFWGYWAGTAIAIALGFQTPKEKI